MTTKTLQNKFHDFIHHIIGGVLGFFSDLSDQIEESGGEILTKAAMAAVVAAEANGGKGSDKFNAAVAAVIATLTAQGIPFLINAVQGAVIAAVAKLQKGE